MDVGRKAEKRREEAYVPVRRLMRCTYISVSSFSFSKCCFEELDRYFSYRSLELFLEWRDGSLRNIQSISVLFGKSKVEVEFQKKAGEETCIHRHVASIHLPSPHGC